jgi:glycine/D-amino acid oxidase-like deaminating enzyme
MSARRNHEIMRLYLEEVVAKGDLSILDEIADTSVIDHAAEASGWWSGRDGWLDHVNYFRAAWAGVEVTVHRITADDDGVVGLWTASGIHTANGSPVDAAGHLLEYAEPGDQEAISILQQAASAVAATARGRLQNSCRALSS